MKPQKSTRSRGVVLSSVGLKRLQAAILAMEVAENYGQRLTLEKLGERMNISTKTLSRLLSLDTGVDQKTLKLCFSAFNLELNPQDYTILNEADKVQASQLISLNLHKQKTDLYQSLVLDSFVNEQADQFESFWPYPDGPVPLDSPLYIERPPLEELVYREIIQPGCVIRIKAPRQMGKSSLVLRLLAFAQKQGYRTANWNCYQIDSESLTNLNKLLRGFCWHIARELGIDPNLNEMWDEEIGCKLSSSFYLQSYLLKQITSPVVLVLNEVDRFFEYPHIAQEFFALLRSWCEEAQQNPNWQKLKLVVVYSTEEYATLNINRSPFNIGLPIRLGEFTQQQIEDLARRHGLNWNSSKESSQLMSFVGGHPALIRISLYFLCSQEMTLQEMMEEAIANGGIYRYHLWRLWLQLQEKPTLAKTYGQLIKSQRSTYVNPIETYKLDSLGLIRFEGDRIIPSCELYRAYFGKQLSTIV
ncbi:MULTISPECIES: AAA-like domain-containing protein [Nostoc]|uniref:AAA-like domain-containing protein n=1 Tax=Nostoc paludosum FACHB-159 TaxID=2692908 RepID=A0ABR8KFM3_9NOSO|nr:MULTISPECIES: AAA-like domain-containing protein [Nostoc]MBD2681187.1 AAA-like domain-containing protein [Nostoc sp. FACHB-857]MBD2737636.1 AAA-like domain-containing protein [Nostoc paludosum FACHB-159]